nr:helix-turn-helix domain-containing protein [Endozoicomonas sp.]
MPAKSKYNAAMCDQVKELMATGLSRKATATEMGISYNTFLSYIDKYEEFAVAVAQADVLAEVFWEDRYMQGALGINKDVQPSMLIMYMKNRYHWRDRQEQTVIAEKIPTLDEWLEDRDQ